jgi:hypothetical protein
VKSNDPARAGALMQTIDILGNESHVTVTAGPGREDGMGTVRLAAGDQLTSPVVPFPNQRRVSPERVRRGQILWSMSAPQPVGPPECGNPAGR